MMDMSQEGKVVTILAFLMFGDSLLRGDETEQEEGT